MFPASSSSGERLPLLRQRATLLGVCLLYLPNLVICTLLYLLFLSHLYRHGMLGSWLSSVWATFFGDIVCVLALCSFWSVFFALLFFGSVGRMIAVGAGTLAVVGSWIALMVISNVHHLEVVWWEFKLQHVLILNWPEALMGSQLGKHMFWLGLPVGLMKVLAATAWRPLVFWFRWGVFSAATLQWYELREIAVGTVMWLCVFLVLFLTYFPLPNTPSEARWLIPLSAVLLVAFVFYLSSEPLLWFYSFMLSSVVDVGCAGIAVRFPELEVEEWFAVVLMSWWVLKMLYISASRGIEQRYALPIVEQEVKYALENPFRAELENDFGRVGVDLEQGLETLVSHVVLGAEPLKTLREKHRALIVARQEALQTQVGGAAALPDNLKLSVRRECIWGDSARALVERPVSELLAPSMTVIFVGEQGVDGGGLKRDWFDSVAKALLEEAEQLNGKSLLACAPDQTLVPRPIAPDSDEVSDDDQAKFRELLALGRFLALSIYRDQPLPMSFSIVACKHLLRVPVGMDDVRNLDGDFYRWRVEQVLKDGGIEEATIALGEPLTFLSAPTELMPKQKELKPGGAQTLVTEENKTEYLQLLCEAHLCAGRREIQCMLQGFWDLLPLEMLVRCGLTPREVSVLISGISEIDPDDWRCHSEICCDDTEVLRWFWEVVEELTLEQRCMLLHFATGSSRLPPGGFQDLKPKFSVDISKDSSDHLPHSHTCVNKLVLCRYFSKDQMQEKVLQAITSQGFGFA